MKNKLSVGDRISGETFFWVSGQLQRIPGEEIDVLVNEWCEPAEAKELADAVAKLSEAANVISRIRHRYNPAFEEFLKPARKAIAEGRDITVEECVEGAKRVRKAVEAVQSEA
jgi:cytidylate kinase